MYYFVGFNLGKNITGIEKAMINRMELFNANNSKAMCIFLSWNRFISKYSSRFIKKNDYINMYDYFQNSISISSVSTIDYISYWKNECHYELKYVPNSNDIRIYSCGKFIMYVRFLDDKYINLDYINYFDDNGNKIKRDFYDIRGFLSCTRILTKNQLILSEQYYNPSGQIVIEKFFDVQNHSIERIILHHRLKTLFFDSEIELCAYFIESIYQYGDLFFSDKNLYTAPTFNKVNPDIPVVAVLHSTHVKNINQVSSSRYKNVYKDIFNNLSRYKAIIVSTKSQKIDVSNRINHEIPVINIPVGFIENYQTDTEKNTIPRKLISVARYSPEKQLHHQIKLINSLKSDFPDIQLHLYGFGIEKENLINLIAQYKLENNVFLRGFIPDLSQEYNNAYLSIVTSNMEGFSLALLEGQSFGIPTISYDIKYGPNELVKNEVNGYLIPKNNEEILLQKVRYLLTHPNVQKEFSRQSKLSAQKYSKEILIEKWNNALVFLDTKKL